MAHSTERSQPDNEDEDDLVSLIQSLNHRAATLGARVVEELFPPATSRLQRSRHTLLDPPMFGAEENYSFSSMQINISSLTQRNLSSLGYSGRSHTDRHDDPMSLTVLICVSHLKPGTYPGNFYIGETREWCELNPFSLLLFRGTGPHGGTQAVSARQPHESEKRINLILYPRKEFVNRTVDIVYPYYSEQQIGDYSFFADGAACFGSDKYHRSWCSRELFRHMTMENKKYGLPVEGSNLQQAFTAFTGSTNRYIDPESPEGLDIKKSITEANQIMEPVRPSWVAADKATKPVTNPPHRTAQKRPAEEHSTTPQSDQSAASTNPAKRTWVGSQTTSEPRRSTRLTRSVANMSSTATHPPLSPSYSTIPSQSPKQKKANTSDREIDVTEAHPQLGEDVVDDSHSTRVGTSTSLNSTSVVELLQNQPLFQISTMKEQVESIRQKAKLLPSKFTKRTPLLAQTPAPKRRALLPPKTNGTTIVECLLQLAEEVQWLTQKSEHLWFYQRALDEHYIHKLLQVGPLFDHDTLIRIFKNSNRNEGAGFCSRTLMDKVVLMVNKMTEMDDGAEEVIAFDPEELLGRQHQQKFCATVEVKVRPFRGHGAYAHMAQHFREVLDLWFEV